MKSADGGKARPGRCVQRMLLILFSLRATFITRLLLFGAVQRLKPELAVLNLSAPLYRCAFNLLGFGDCIMTARLSACNWKELKMNSVLSFRC